MLTKITIRNFKRFDEVEIELGNPVVFVGPNNSGKTSALQAIALWNMGAKRWVEKRKDSKAQERYGAPINRLDLLTIPVPTTELLWRNLSLRKKSAKEKNSATENIYIDIIVKGVTEGKEWEAGLGFYYQNTEVLYCRPKDAKNLENIQIASQTKIAYLPPMSGLAAEEDMLQIGSIQSLIGQGRTAEVLRNLCYKILYPESELIDNKREEIWQDLVQRIKDTFGVILNKPEFIKERGKIRMTYQEDGIEESKSLDISSSGRGLQQVLLLLSYMLSNPNSVLLLDEPDAHLEILRQREIYKLLTEIAIKQKSQIIIATHSEVVLSEAEKDIVVAFIGKKPHVMRSISQVRKSLTTIGYHDYYQSEATGWVLYLEGSTDLDVLQSFAKVLNYKEAMGVLKRPFVKYVGNLPNKAEEHYYGLQEAYPNLRGIAIFDHIDNVQLKNEKVFKEFMWQRREIENYFAFPEILEKYCEQGISDDLFSLSENEKRRMTMKKCIEKIVPPIALENRNDSWWLNTKMSDDFLARVFELYFKEINLPNTFRKTNYHELILLMTKEQMLPEVKEKLDDIVEIASK